MCLDPKIGGPGGAPPAKKGPNTTVAMHRFEGFFVAGKQIFIFYKKIRPLLFEHFFFFMKKPFLKLNPSFAIKLFPLKHHELPPLEVQQQVRPRKMIVGWKVPIRLPIGTWEGNFF